MELDYKKYYKKSKIRRVINIRILEYISKLTKKNFYIESKLYKNLNILDIKQTNLLIGDMIKQKQPYLIGRYGGTEMNLIITYLGTDFLGEHALEKATKQLCDLSGFFPKDVELAKKFAEMMLEISSEIDLLGIWDTFMEDYLCNRFTVNSSFTRLRYLEPYYALEENILPWTSSLSGLKVLVIHPFSDSIEYQYKNRDKIWPQCEMLPKFELKTIKAVQTIADQEDDRFNNWFEALEYMVEEAKKIDFDVALVGCGAYGLPLAAEIKKNGKCAIHLGGALQILFGIRGVRWDNHSVISKFYNEYWIRPFEIKPKAFEKVEKGCYW